MSDVYWASEDFEELAGVLSERSKKYYEHLMVTGRMRTWKNVKYHYHQTYFNGAELRQSGENGEYELLTINHFRNILNHMTNMVSGEKISFTPTTINTDSKSQKQALLSRNILEYYIKERKVDRLLRICDKYALMYGEGFMHLRWDVSQGALSPYDINKENYFGVEANSENMINEGDIIFSAHTPDNVVRDIDAESFEASDWIIVREWKNKWNLAAQFPEIKDEIIALGSHSSPYVYNDKISDEGDYFYKREDMIEHFTFYHKRTAALPNGRMVEYLNDNIVLTDADLPHDVIPVFREVPEEMENSVFGSSIAFDLVQIQEAINILNSIIVTNQKNFGIGTIVIDDNSKYRYDVLSQGLKVLKVKGGPMSDKPSILNLLNTSAEIFNYAEKLVQHMEQISGVNSVVRGAPQASLESGSALAMVHSTAVKFNESRHLSYVSVVEDVGTNIVNFLKRFALTKRVVAISGKSNRSYLESFNSDDLTDINRVTMEVQSSLMSTTAGRVQVAENMIRTGITLRPEEYLAVIETGRLEPLIEHETAELMLIRSENEELTDGRDQIAVLTDNHQLHIKEHKAVLASTDARRDPEIVDKTLAHIQQHINMLQDPNNAALFQMLGQQALPPQSGAPNVSGPMTSQNEASPAMPSLPELPNKPGQGQYNPQTGAAAPTGAPAQQYNPNSGT